MTTFSLLLSTITTTTLTLSQFNPASTLDGTYSWISQDGSVLNLHVCKGLGNDRNLYAGVEREATNAFGTPDGTHSFSNMIGRADALKRDADGSHASFIGFKAARFQMIPIIFTLRYSQCNNIYQLSINDELITLSKLSNYVANGNLCWQPGPQTFNDYVAGESHTAQFQFIGGLSSPNLGGIGLGPNSIGLGSNIGGIANNIGGFGGTIGNIGSINQLRGGNTNNIGQVGQIGQIRDNLDNIQNNVGQSSQGPQSQLLTLRSEGNNYYGCVNGFNAQTQSIGNNRGNLLGNTYGNPNNLQNPFLWNNKLMISPFSEPDNKYGCNSGFEMLLTRPGGVQCNRICGNMPTVGMSGFFQQRNNLVNPNSCNLPSLQGIGGFPHGYGPIQSPIIPPAFGSGFGLSGLANPFLGGFNGINSGLGLQAGVIGNGLLGGTTSTIPGFGLTPNFLGGGINGIGGIGLGGIGLGAGLGFGAGLGGVGIGGLGLGGFNGGILGYNPFINGINAINPTTGLFGGFNPQFGIGVNTPYGNIPPITGSNIQPVTPIAGPFGGFGTVPHAVTAASNVVDGLAQNAIVRQQGTAQIISQPNHITLVGN